MTILVWGGVLFIAFIIGLLCFGTFYSEPMKMYPERAKNIIISLPQPIIPGPGMPKGFSPLRSTNNVDLIRVDNAIFMGFRTAPSHFASDQVQLYVMRSDDEGQTWKEDLCLHIGRDLREPRFFNFKNRLFLYFFTGGVSPLNFEPNYIHVCERQDDGIWTEPKPIYKPGYVVWRAREHNGMAYMSVYYGTDIYRMGNRGEVRLLKSVDGIHWENISEYPQVDHIGAEEAEFVFDANGNIVALVRLEVTGGALICRAPANNISQWKCKFTQYKVDSSLMFRHSGRYFVVGRRNVAGCSARGKGILPERLHNMWNMFFYSITRKRTCLYEIDPEALELYPLVDLPSRGDTAFAGIVSLSQNRYYLVNYSSPLDKLDLPWIVGQLLGSRLYAFVLDFSGIQ